MSDTETNMFDHIIAILQILVPFVSAVLLYYLATIKETKVSKHKVYRERLDHYYIPFYQMYCRGFLSEEYPMGERPFDNRKTFLDLFSNNLQYMDATSQSLYSRYYQAFLNLMEAEHENPLMLPAAKQEMNSVFDAIAKATFKEYKRLLRRLKLPVPKI